MHNESTVFIYIDDDIVPIGEYKVPIHFEFDTTKIIDGNHIFIVVNKSSSGKEGIRKILFTVRNGPSIAIEGLDENAVVDGVLPLMINAYSKGDKKIFYRRKRNTSKYSGMALGNYHLIRRLDRYNFITSLNMNL